MKKGTSTKQRLDYEISVIFFVVLMLLLVFSYSRYSTLFFDYFRKTDISSALIPWQSIGGCGANTHNNYSLDVFGAPLSPFRLQSKQTVTLSCISGIRFGSNYNSIQFVPGVEYSLSRRFYACMSIPVEMRKQKVQYRSNLPAKTVRAGGFGDFRIGGGAVFFDKYPLIFFCQLQFPTGKYNIKTGSSRDKLYLPTTLQKGSGIYSLTLSLEYILKVYKKNRLRLFAGYVFPFNMKLFSGKNEFLSNDLKEYQNDKNNKRFYYHFKPYGENDLGRYIPQELLFSSYYSHCVNDYFLHAWAMHFDFILGVNWIPDYNPGVYDPKPDMTHRMWQLKFIYIPEVRFNRVVIMCFLSVPLFDKANSAFPNSDLYNDASYSKIDGPDWRGLLSNWAIGIGIRYQIFIPVKK